MQNLGPHKVVDIDVVAAVVAADAASAVADVAGP